jgi:hypothetical protein
MKMLRLTSCTAALILLASCGETEVAETPPKPQAASLDSWFTADAPADAAAIHVARETAKPGDEITLKGLVMGRMKPFVDGRAAFVLGDDEILTPCNRKPDDECDTPWDVCCDSAADKLKGTATIQITGDDGRVLDGSLRGVHGLTELSAVTVRGLVAEGSSPEALIVNATAIHVQP